VALAGSSPRRLSVHPMPAVTVHLSPREPN
jgi:hypothetical protein